MDDRRLNANCDVDHAPGELLLTTYCRYVIGSEGYTAREMVFLFYDTRARLMRDRIGHVFIGFYPKVLKGVFVQGTTRYHLGGLSKFLRNVGKTTAL